jgi:hypothetical protein
VNKANEYVLKARNDLGKLGMLMDMGSASILPAAHFDRILPSDPELARARTMYQNGTKLTKLARAGLRDLILGDVTPKGRADLAKGFIKSSCESLGAGSRRETNERHDEGVFDKILTILPAD